MRLQHNIMAQSAYRSYKKNVSGMKKNLERLASGYKVNRAADDAAGLAISEKMRAQITGEEAAQKNAKDGISLVQTAEGALAEVHDILDRMVELATQSANGTYDNDTDRYQLQKEMDLLLDEINRIADSSNFNSIPLLDGSMDAGGNDVFTSGSFQINNSTLHPMGLDAGSIELPDVGRELGKNTVLHTGGTLGGDTNAFSIDLHNVILNANSTISISVGDGVSITVTNNSDEPVTAEDIVAAINGNTSKKISVDYGNANVGKSERGNVTVTLGQNSEFELKANGTRLTFTQFSGDDIEMPKEVKITDSTPPLPDVTGTGNVTESQKPEDGNPAKYTIDLSGFTVSASGGVTVEVLGQEFDLWITQDEFLNKGSKPIGTVLADKLKEKLNDALNAGKFPPDSEAGAVSFSSRDGKVIVEFTNPDKQPVDAPYKDMVSKGVNVTTAVYKDGDTVKMDPADMKFPDPEEPDTGGVRRSTLTVEIDGVKYDFKIVAKGASGSENPDDNTVIVKDPNEDWNSDSIQKQIEDKLNQRLEETNRRNREGKGDYSEVVNVKVVDGKVRYECIKKEYIGVDDDSGSSGSGGGSDGPGGSVNPAAPGKNFTGDYNKSTTVLQTQSEGTKGRLASTCFDLSKLTDADGHISEGTSITIGRNTYTFTYDASKIGKDGYVVLNGGENPDDLATAAEKLTKAAENNLTYTVGHDGSGSRITVTEKEGQTYFDLTTMEGIEKSLGFKTVSTTPVSGAKGMTLQVGDTDDVYSKLDINIKDCHTLALGIDGISIARQDDAAAAVNAIRAAKNYVSDVRGTLGAAQNRLEHTINNLSVMAENVQDAEATIRDADIAEEMMSYTKNNILIQSAQSMLAQANQVPQGVLQLLQ